MVLQCVRRGGGWCYGDVCEEGRGDGATVCEEGRGGGAMVMCVRRGEGGWCYSV